ncbi:hypothetical protein ABIE18_003534 [Arthrobacter sp. 2762]
MTEPVRRLAALSPAPRHLRKRRFRSEIPSSLMAGYLAQGPIISPCQPSETPSEDAQTAKAITPAKGPGGQLPEPHDVTHGQKRLIALVLVILVSVSIPVLALTLIFAP